VEGGGRRVEVGGGWDGDANMRVQRMLHVDAARMSGGAAFCRILLLAADDTGAPEI
jgi:hypothetical protein